MYVQLQLRGQREVGQSVKNTNTYQINQHPVHMLVELRWESFHFPSCCASIKQDGCCAGNVNNKSIYSIQASSPMSKITIKIIIIIIIIIITTTTTTTTILLLLELKKRLSQLLLAFLSSISQFRQTTTAYLEKNNNTKQLFIFKNSNNSLPHNELVLLLIQSQR